MGWDADTLIRACQRTGYPVAAAWTSKYLGEQGTVVGCMKHHTATSAAAGGDYPSLNVIMNGHSTLSGPLAQIGMGRSGTLYLITTGLAHHAGVGEWAGITNGNAHFLGIEAENDGSGDWTAEQRDCYPRLVASILLEVGRGPEWAPRHAEYAPTRKTDTAGFDEAEFDALVAHYLAYPHLIPRGASAPQEDEEDMAIMYQNPTGIYIADGAGYRHVGEPVTVDNLLRAGVKLVSISLAEHQRWMRSRDTEQLPRIITVAGFGVDEDWPGIWALDASGYHHVGSMATVDVWRAKGADEDTISRAEHDEWVRQVGTVPA